jgi:FHS family L-fucose permease-like MFS transporter
MKQNRNYAIPIILVTSLFFLWAFLHNINPILIPHLKKACQLSDTQSAFIDTAVYLAYFTIALPAGFFMHRFGYKKGILFGLFLYGTGALLFLPAASTRNYALFLGALFVIAAGATFLETVANPYMTKLGDERNGARRLNFAQSFNGVGAFLAPIIGGKFILSGIEHTPSELQQMGANGQLNTYLQSEANTVRMPYLVIAGGVLLLLALFAASRLPETDAPARDSKAPRFSWQVLRIPQVTWAVVAQFFYVGAQVGVGSFFIRFARQAMALPEKEAAYWWGYIAMVGFMAGRFVGTFLMKYIRPERLLAVYAFISIALLMVAVFTQGKLAVFALMGVPFFMSIMFPTIFALGVKGLGEETKIASSFIIMSIVGGAFCPLVMGAISDVSGSIQLAYLMPAACFVVVLLFALRRNEKATVTTDVLAYAH